MPLSKCKKTKLKKNLFFHIIYKIKKETGRKVLGSGHGNASGRQVVGRCDIQRENLTLAL